MKKPILVSLILLKHPLKALMLVQLIPSTDYSVREKDTRVHRNLISFQQCPLVPLKLSSKD